ncbi:MAG: hypothetical protein ACP5I7_02640 [Sulfolobales archaeon]
MINMSLPENTGREEYIEIFGGLNDLFYATMRSAIEAAKIIRINHKRKIYVLPTDDLINIKFTLNKREVYVRINGRIFKITEPPNIEWFIDKIMSSNEATERDNTEISLTVEEDRSIFGVQEILL